ncbi:MAG TPA: helix-turn-helix domain-containing protein [Patescibacteria group bacterium]|nr:helix-turn-helix domain-containing protein [Patescibacteria group bacterium]
MDVANLKKLGFSDKSAKLYLELLSLGPSSVRVLAKHTGLNRGVIYELLKELQSLGLVNFYNTETKQRFVAENPEKLDSLLQTRKAELVRVETQLPTTVAELQALYNQSGQPTARYYEQKDLPKILEDVLTSCEQAEEREYRIYSASGLREYLYENFSTFSDVRIGKSIAVKVLAIGQGGELRGLDERKWLPEPKKQRTNSYIIIYPGKTAYVSLNTKGEPMGIVVANDSLYQTQKIIFDNLWDLI